MFVNHNNSVMEIKCHHHQFMKENARLWVVKNFSEISHWRAMLGEFTRSKAWEQNSCTRDLLCFALRRNLCWSEGSKIDKGKKLMKSFLEKSSFSLIPKHHSLPSSDTRIRAFVFLTAQSLAVVCQRWGLVVSNDEWTPRHLRVRGLQLPTFRLQQVPTAATRAGVEGMALWTSERAGVEAQIKWSTMVLCHL